MKTSTSADLTRLTHFIARLIALVPKPWVNLTRSHGVFPPTERIVRGYRRPSAKASMVDAKDAPTSVERRVSMTWAQRLKRVFNIDIETCNCLGEHVKIIA